MRLAACVWEKHHHLLTVDCRLLIVDCGSDCDCFQRTATAFNDTTGVLHALRKMNEDFPLPPVPVRPEPGQNLWPEEEQLRAGGASKPASAPEEKAKASNSATPAGMFRQTYIHLHSQ